MNKHLFTITLFILASLIANAQTSCPPHTITSSANGYNYGGSFNTNQQSGLNYNADLNMVLFTAPVSPHWQYSGKTDYDIQASWYNLNTQLWDSAIIYRDSTGNKKAAFCGGAIFNPTGNTTIANAFIVATGPWQDSSGKWGGVFYNAIHPIHQFITNSDSNIHIINSAPFGSTAFLNADIQQAGDKIFVAGVLNNPNDSTKNTIRGGVIAQADFSTGKAVWTVDSILPNFYNSPTKGYLAKDFRLAFGADVQTGYAVFTGAKSTVFPCVNINTLGPLVYKTIDAAQSWQPVQMDDWYIHGECLKNLSDSFNLHPPYYSLYYSMFYNPYGTEHGFDITVDANNTLHLVTTLGNIPYNGVSLDSIMDFKYNKQWDYINYHPVIWDFTTDGTHWSTMLVDSIIASPTGIDPSIDTTAAYGVWKGKNGKYLGVSSRIKLSRSIDGKIVFYTWEDTDQNIWNDTFNIYPDILAKGFNVITNKITSTINMTNGVSINSSGCFFYNSSKIVTGTYASGNWQLPLSWQSSSLQNSNHIYDGTQPVNYYYLPCANFSSSEFNTQAVIYSPDPSIYSWLCEDGIKQIPNSSAQVIVYPNPAQNSLQITVSNEQITEIKITDVLGNEIKNEELKMQHEAAQIDVSNLQTGVYFMQLKTQQKTYIQKVIIQR